MTSALQLFEHFLRYERRNSDLTVRAYLTDIAQFDSYVADQYEVTEWNEVMTPMVRSWLVTLMRADLKNRSVNRKISSLKTFYKFLLREEVVDHNPIAEIGLLKTSKRLPEFAQASQLEDLSDKELFTDDFPGKRDRAIIYSLYALGIRRAELLNLKIKDFDSSRGVMRIQGKGNKERFVPLLPLLKEILEDYLSVYNSRFGYSKDSPFFILDNGLPIYEKFVYNVSVKYLSEVSTIQSKGPHTWRHSFATHLSNEGADINALKGLLGHASLAATQVYTHNSIEQLKQVYKQSHPRSQEKKH